MSEKAPQINSDLVAGQYGEVDQKVYSNGVKHVYGVDPTTGKKRHISHEEILNAYGHTSKEAENNMADFVLNPQELTIDPLDLTEDDIEDQENLDAEWEDLKVTFANAIKSGNYAEMAVAMDEFKMFIDQFEGMSEEEKQETFKELVNPTTESVTEETTEAAEAVDSVEASDDANEQSIQDRAAFNEGVENLLNKYADKDYSDETVKKQCKEDVEKLLSDTNQQYPAEQIIAIVKGEDSSADAPNQTADSENEPEPVVQSNLDVAADSSAEQEDAAADTSGVIARLRDWWRTKNAKANAAVTLAALNAADRVQNNGGSNDAEAEEATEGSVASTEESSQEATNEVAETTDEKAEKKRKWPIVVAAIGIAAVGGYMAWKYGISPKLNGEAQATVGDVAAAGGAKLTRAQESLLDASGSTPWDRYSDVYGPEKAGTKLLRAVERLKESGIKVIEHGSGKDYWIEVPKANGKGFTSGVDRVTKVLATGTV